MKLTIGELSRRAGVKVPTIRYYEQIGLLPAPARTEGRQRRYGEDEASRLDFIRHARELGFEIDAVRELLELSGKPETSCATADAIARRHMTGIERRIEQLSALRDELRRMTQECSHGRVCECRVIQVLADHGQCAHDHH